VTQPELAIIAATTTTHVNLACTRRIVPPRGRAGQAVVAFLSCAIFACVGTGEGVPDPVPDDSAVPRTFDDIQAMIFDPACATQCHRGGAAPKGLSMEARLAFDQLVNVPSVELPEMMRVAPGRPEESFLIVKVASGDRRRVGARMPRNGPPFLSSRQVRALRLWIRDGATEDWVDTSSASPTVSTSSLVWRDDFEEGEDEE